MLEGSYDGHPEKPGKEDENYSKLGTFSSGKELTFIASKRLCGVLFRVCHKKTLHAFVKW